MPYVGPLEAPSLDPITLDSGAVETIYSAMGTSVAVAVGLCAAMGHGPEETVQILATMCANVVHEIAHDPEHGVGAWAAPTETRHA